MIRTFRSKALSRYWTKGDERGLRPDWRNKVRIVLSRLDVAHAPGEMNLPGLRFHALTGNLKNRFAVSVSPNWRITFAWDGEDAIDVDLEDYHGK
jgi:proteic killer suppression protein